MKKELLTLCAIPLTELCEFTQEELAETICKWMNFLRNALEVEQNLHFTTLDYFLKNYLGQQLQLIVYLKVEGEPKIAVGQQAELNLVNQLPLQTEGSLEIRIEEDVRRLCKRWKEIEEAAKAAPSVLGDLNISAFFNESNAVHPKYKELKKLVTKVPKSRVKKLMTVMSGQKEFSDFNLEEWDIHCYSVRAQITRTEKGYRAAFIHSDIAVSDCKRFDLYRPSDPEIDDALNKADRERAAIDLRIRVGRLFGDDLWSFGRVQSIE